jgi:DNA-damage-inducible protein J
MLNVYTKASKEIIMPRTAIIQARIDPDVKKKAQKILEKLNISMSETISLYLTQVTLQRGIPFEIRLPGQTTLAALRDVEERKNLHSANSVDEFFEKVSE